MLVHSNYCNILAQSIYILRRFAKSIPENSMTLCFNDLPVRIIHQRISLVIRRLYMLFVSRLLKHISITLRETCLCTRLYVSGTSLLCS